jgi:hypothetical protein
LKRRQLQQGENKVDIVEKAHLISCGEFHLVACDDGCDGNGGCGSCGGDDCQHDDDDDNNQKTPQSPDPGQNGGCGGGCGGGGCKNKPSPNP